ncbi:PHP domain-containing protein [Rugosimonospora africana]|uniref:Histidinol-phosphatase n=1 Tax=Rugosimonospora africana TaxID=556532 RepID=A0A8J3R325_9ACTN|nr:PHP domain-containing protein [Rugosimonospora africana]GIH20977.1 histidinol-phosphatase [Rugosimonospora africana]
MLPVDNHVHSQWSFDTEGQASMARACEQALALGLPALAFTEHVEWTDWIDDDVIATDPMTLKWWDKIRPLDVTGYFADIEECRERYKPLRIFSGVEAGEPHLFAGSIKGVLATGPFDRVLGSLHAVPYGGDLVAAESLFRLLGSYDEAMRCYFAELIRMIEGVGEFEVLAHLDYPRRYWPGGSQLFDEPKFEEEYRAVLRALAGTGRVLEVNTKSPMATADLMRWWREEGGRAVSFGSDAHRPWLVGGRFDVAVDVVEAAGFRPGRDQFDFWRR